jgi:hypothetical protein
MWPRRSRGSCLSDPATAAMGYRHASAFRAGRPEVRVAFACASPIVRVIDLHEGDHCTEMPANTFGSGVLFAKRNPPSGEAGCFRAAELSGTAEFPTHPRLPSVLGSDLIIRASFIRKQPIFIMITIITILLLLTSRNCSICRHLSLIGDCHNGC